MAQGSGQIIRFRTVLPTQTDLHAIRYVEYDPISKTGNAYYCDPETGARVEREPLAISAEYEWTQRVTQWLEQGDTFLPGWV